MQTVSTTHADKNGYYVNSKGEYQNPSLYIPAVTLSDGTQIFYEKGKVQRGSTQADLKLDLPAMIYPNGTRTWLFASKYNRIYGPAIEWSNGDEDWYILGKFHRRGNHPARIFRNGPHLEFWDMGRCLRKQLPCGTRIEYKIEKIAEKNVSTEIIAYGTGRMELWHDDEYKSDVTLAHPPSFYSLPNLSIPSSENNSRGLSSSSSSSSSSSPSKKRFREDEDEKGLKSQRAESS